MSTSSVKTLFVLVCLLSLPAHADDRATPVRAERPVSITALLTHHSGGNVPIPVGGVRGAYAPLSWLEVGVAARMFAAFYVNTELEARYIPFEWRLSPYLSARGGYRIALDEDYGDAPWRAGAGLGLDYSARSGFQTWLEIGGDFGFGESTDGGPLFQFGMGYRF